MLGFVPFLGNESKIAKISKNIASVARSLGRGFFAYAAVVAGPTLAKKLWN